MAIKYEAVRPTSAYYVSGLTPTDAALATAIIDEDPDEGGIDFLEGPSTGGTGQSGPHNAVSSSVHPGSTSGQLDNVANALGNEEGLYASSSLSTRNSYYGNGFRFGTLFSGVPDDATITSVQTRARMHASTSSGVGSILAIYSGGSLILETGETTVTQTVPTNYTWNPSTLPTVAQLKSPTFEYAIRARRTVNQGRTFFLDWVEITVVYTEAGKTNPIEVRVQMGVPVDPLADNVDSLSEVRMQVRKKGDGSDPPVTVELRENGILKSTVINNTPVSQLGSQVVSNTFDQNPITNAGADVELWIKSPGVQGAMVEVGSIEWVAEMLSALIVLDWNDNTESDLDHYNVYRADVSGGPYTKINETPVYFSTYEDNTASIGVTYYYVVTAVDVNGNESNYSTEAASSPANVEEVRTAVTYVANVPQAGARSSLAKARAALTSMGSIFQLANMTRSRVMSALTHVAPIFNSALRLKTGTRVITSSVDSIFNVTNRLGMTKSRSGSSFMAELYQLANMTRSRVLSALTFVENISHSGSVLSKLHRQAASYLANNLQGSERLRSALRVATSFLSPLEQLSNVQLGRLRTAITHMVQAEQSGTRTMAQLREIMSHVEVIAQGASRNYAKTRAALTYMLESEHTSARVRSLIRQAIVYVETAQLANRNTQMFATAVSHVATILHTVTAALTNVSYRTAVTTMNHIINSVSVTKEAYRTLINYVAPLQSVATRAIDKLRTGLSYAAPIFHTGSRVLEGFRSSSTYMTTAQLANRTGARLRSAVDYLEEVYHTAGRNTRLFRAIATTVGPIFQRTTVNIAMFLYGTATTFVEAFDSSASLTKSLYKTATTYLNSYQEAMRNTGVYKNVATYVEPIVQSAVRALTQAIFRSTTTFIEPLNNLSSRTKELFKLATSYVAPLQSSGSRFVHSFRTMLSYVSPIAHLSNMFTGVARTALSYVSASAHLSNRIRRLVRGGTSYVQALHSAASRRSALYRTGTNYIVEIVQRASGIRAIVMFRTAVSYIVTEQIANRTKSMFRLGTTVLETIRHLVRRFSHLFRSSTTSTDFENISTASVSRPRSVQTFVEFLEQRSVGKTNIYVPPGALPIVNIVTIKKPVAISVFKKPIVSIEPLHKQVAVERRKGQVSLERVKKPVEITVSEGNVS